MSSATGAGDATLPQLLLARAAQAPQTDAVRRKQFGIWHATSWSALAEQVEAVAHGLSAVGVRPGDVVAVVSDNRPEWLVVELAVQSLQAAVAGPHPESGGGELAHLLAAVGARAVVVEDAQQLALVRAAAGDLPELVLAVCVEGRAVHAAADGGLDVRLLDDVAASGRQAAAATPAWWRARVAQGRAGDVAVLCPLDDSSATPEQLLLRRSTPLSHGNLLAAATSLTAQCPVSAKTRYVSVLPLGWTEEQVAGVAASLRTGFALNFPESPSTQQSDLRDIGPDLLLAPARLWESMADELLAAVDGAGWARNATWTWASGLGSRRSASGTSSPAWRVADVLVLRAVRDRLGMTRLGTALSFGGPLRADVADLFRSVGVDLRQLCGSADAGGPVAVEGARRARAPHPVVVGGLPGVEVRLAEDGEVLVRSDAVPASPARATRDADGWLHTGDVGRLDGDGLVLRGRRSDLIPVGDLEVDPRTVEAALRLCPYVEEAVVVPGSCPGAGLAALLIVDPATTGTWVEAQRLHAASYPELLGLPEVARLLADEVARVVRDAPGGDAVRRCVLASRRLDVERGEVTRSRVVRRHVVAAHFADELAALGGAGAHGTVVVDVPGAAVPAVQEATT